MLRNYFTIAVRNIRRNLGFTLINVMGLALGITCSLVLFLMIRFSTSFDNYHPNGDRIYRVVSSNMNRDREDFGAGVPPPLPDAVRNDISGIEKVLFISRRDGGVVSVEDQGERKLFEEQQGVGVTDATYFQFFKQDLLRGNPENILSAPNEGVISLKMARKYFGDDDPIGKVVRLDNSIDVKITGLMEDYPENTNFPFDLLLSFVTIQKEKEEEGWHSIYSDDQCYVMLQQGTDPETVNQQFPAFIKKYMGDDTAERRTQWIQPLAEINHDTRFSNYRYSTTSYESIYAMGVIAIFLIITACINFINLSTAVAVKRSKEVGVRKVLGSQRLQLVFQFLSETAIITLLALLASFGMAELSLIRLNSFLDLNLHVTLSDPGTFTYLMSVWLLVTLTSGFYPALLLSGFSPAVALKNKMTNRSAGGFLLRRSLVVFQFVISQILVVGTVILLTQMNFVKHKDLGFAKDAIVLLPIPEVANLDKKSSLKNEIQRLGGVEKTSLCFMPPSSGSVSSTNYKVIGSDENYHAQEKEADADYISLFEMTMVAGRQLPESDTASGWIVNEKLARVSGYETPDEMLGVNMKMRGKILPVIGVIKDFHTLSLQREIDPVVLYSDKADYYNLAVKLKGGDDYKTTLDQMKQQWEALYPDFVFSYKFLDDEISGFYESQEKMSVLLVIFSCIAILIGSLGLYGLISFLANEKEKEIGVRKVLGATTGQIMYIFSREFVVLVLIAFVIASPLAGYVMSAWLEKFTYRIELNWIMFTGGVGLTLFIAFLTVGYRSLRAAQTNPVNVLRSE